MKHLIICTEYPPTPFPAGGIGTYVSHISRLLAESGETVHVITPLWDQHADEIEKKNSGTLIVHRVPRTDCPSIMRWQPGMLRNIEVAKRLLESNLPSQNFSWQAGLLTEYLVEKEDIDIIECQEYDAPLYYFQLRRALGFGPSKQPPCLVHLHSPTEFIALHNDRDMGHSSVTTAKRLEDYSIAAADALICPSRFVALQAERHYGLAERTTEVIPLPIGDTQWLDRDQDTWKNGSICYIGRLERRKGVIEWIDAAVAVARDYPTVHFEFIGANVLGTELVRGDEFVQRRIPHNLKSRFHFRGEQKRSSLPQFLTGARMAVVPSRWENFPNICVEAMCSGLPVIASREGGMAEVIQDGRTGWLADKEGAEGLAHALRRALRTPPAKVAEMGRRASTDIHRICDNKTILERQLAFRRQIVHQGPTRSLRIPMNLPWATQAFSGQVRRRTPLPGSEDGVAVVATCFNDGQSLNECLRSVEQQTEKPAAACIVDLGSTDEQTLRIIARAADRGWRVVRNGNPGIAASKNAGVEAVLDSGSRPVAFVFLTGSDWLEPDCIATCRSVLRRCPEVGLVSGWNRGPGAGSHMWIQPCPTFPYQWVSNDVAPFSLVRTEALHEAGRFRPGMEEGFEDWDMINAVMTAGWVAVTIPHILGTRCSQNGSVMRAAVTQSHRRMRRKLLERFEEMIARDAKEIILLGESNKEEAMRKELHLLKEQYAHLPVMNAPFRALAFAMLRKVKRRILQHIHPSVSPLLSRIRMWGA